MHLLLSTDWETVPAASRIQDMREV